jgi:hypothetical protein
MTANDDKKSCIISKGVVGESINDLELRWLHLSGSSSDSLNDSWFEFLAARGFDDGSVLDMKVQWLDSLGYVGEYNDKIAQFWSDCPDVLGLGGYSLGYSEGYG